jgi:hypothetical protein
MPRPLVRFPRRRDLRGRFHLWPISHKCFLRRRSSRGVRADTCRPRQCAEAPSSARRARRRDINRRHGAGYKRPAFVKARRELAPATASVASPRGRIPLMWKSARRKIICYIHEIIGSALCGYRLPRQLVVGDVNSRHGVTPPPSRGNRAPRARRYRGLSIASRSG